MIAFPIFMTLITIWWIITLGNASIADAKWSYTGHKSNNMFKKWGCTRENCDLKAPH